MAADAYSSSAESEAIPHAAITPNTPCMLMPPMERSAALGEVVAEVLPEGDVELLELLAPALPELEDEGEGALEFAAAAAVVHEGEQASEEDAEYVLPGGMTEKKPLIA